MQKERKLFTKRKLLFTGKRYHRCDFFLAKITNTSKNLLEISVQEISKSHM